MWAPRIKYVDVQNITPVTPIQPQERIGEVGHWR